MRGPFEGVGNVVRFNWPYYLAAAAAIVLLAVPVGISQGVLRSAFIITAVLTVLMTAASIIVSWYVYDRSGFYRFEWLAGLSAGSKENILNINAGFDETTVILKQIFPNAEIMSCDFYEGDKHPAPSIRRARRRYPAIDGVRKISSDSIPFADASVNKIFAVMAAHEIRDAGERTRFFMEAKRCLTSDGRIVLVEHLRDLPNFLAYNVGAFHFQSRASWLDAIASAGLMVENEKKITPFLTAFFIKNGASS